jgi:hypothetical protein
VIFYDLPFSKKLIAIAIDHLDTNSYQKTSKCPNFVNFVHCVPNGPGFGSMRNYGDGLQNA